MSPGDPAGSRVRDLRSALELLAATPGELLTTDEPVDVDGELAAVYRQIGAGTPAPPPTRNGPAMLFRNVRGHDVGVTVGVLAARRRAALLLDSTVEGLSRTLLEALRHPVAPVTWAQGTGHAESAAHGSLGTPDGSAGGVPPCQEVVVRPPLDIRALLPIPRNTPEDAGPYISMGLLRAEDPETGAADVTIHRLCVQGPDTLSVYFAPGRHIEVFRARAEAAGHALPVSVSIGLDPAVYVAACFEPPTTPLGFDELSVAGGLRGQPVELCDCVSVSAKAVAHAEIVVEGEILPGERVREDVQSGLGYSMPEFPGYLGDAKDAVPVMRVTAVTRRRDAILQTVVCPGEEHANLVGIPTEASILRLVEDTMPGRLVGVYCHPSGGGKFLAVMKFRKRSDEDDGRPRQAALAAFAAYTELKHVVLVDDDVDIFNTDDVLWALTTRYQGDADTVFIPAVRCHPLDPSQSPDFSPFLQAQGTSCKTIFDCTVPYALRGRFRRPPFQDIDISRFLPGTPDG